MKKQETIFRQKSIDKVSSPEQLDGYLKVTTPSVWLILIGIILILVGCIAWATFGEIKSYTNVGCVVTSGDATCFVKEEESTKIEVGMTIEIPSENNEFNIISKENSGLNIPDQYDYLQHLIGISSTDYVFALSGKSNIKDGYYAGRVVTEKISPLKFIFN